MGQGLKDPSPSLRAARCFLFFGFFCLCFERKAICTHATQRGCSLTLLWQATEVATRMFARTVIDFGCFRKTRSFN